MQLAGEGFEHSFSAPLTQKQQLAKFRSEAGESNRILHGAKHRPGPTCMEMKALTPTPTFT
jgi:hypothetical protein